MLEDGSVISAIIEKRKALSLQHVLLIGISGIDAAGKGFVTARIAESLQERGLELAVINSEGPRMPPSGNHRGSHHCA
jgi:polyphosphate kinase 2 (PPK2 family)